MASCCINYTYQITGFECLLQARFTFLLIAIHILKPIFLNWAAFPLDLPNYLVYYGYLPHIRIEISSACCLSTLSMAFFIDCIINFDVINYLIAYAFKVL